MSIYKDLREKNIAEAKERLFEDVMVRADNHIVGTLAQKRLIVERAINIAYRQDIKAEDVPAETFYQGHLLMDKVKEIATEELGLPYRENYVARVRPVTIGDLVRLG